MDELESAKRAAIHIIMEATSIVAKFSRDEGWIGRHGLSIPALKFGDFLRDVITTEGLVNAVSDQLLEAKRDDQLIRFGGMCECTAHEVATRFARMVGGVIWLNLWTELRPHFRRPNRVTPPRFLRRVRCHRQAVDAVLKVFPTGTAFEPWPIDGLTTQQQRREFQERWTGIRDDLAGINSGNAFEIIPLIKLEAKRAQSMLDELEQEHKEKQTKLTNSGKKKGMSVSEANRKAVELAEKNAAFIEAPIRDWAKAIGCSVGTVNKTALWIKTQELKEERTSVTATNLCEEHMHAVAVTRDTPLTAAIEKEEREKEEQLAKLTMEQLSEMKNDSRMGKSNRKI